MLDFKKRVISKIFTLFLLGSFFLLLSLWQSKAGWQPTFSLPPAANSFRPLNESSSEQTKEGTLNLLEIARASVFEDPEAPGSYWLDIAGQSQLKGGITLEGNLHLFDPNTNLYSHLLRTRIGPSLNNPPGDCNLAKEGFIYFDIPHQAFGVCDGEDWRFIGRAMLRYIGGTCHYQEPLALTPELRMPQKSYEKSGYITYPLYLSNFEEPGFGRLRAVISFDPSIIEFDDLWAGENIIYLSEKKELSPGRILVDFEATFFNYCFGKALNLGFRPKVSSGSTFVNFEEILILENFAGQEIKEYDIVNGTITLTPYTP
jgi:hypothetical protein